MSAASVDILKYEDPVPFYWQIALVPLKGLVLIHFFKNKC